MIKQEASGSAESTSHAVAEEIVARHREGHDDLATLDRLLVESEWTQVVDLATQLLSEAPSADQAAEVYVRRGEARLKLDAFADAKEDIERAWQFEPRPPRAGPLLLQVLRKFAQWPEILKALNDLLADEATASTELALRRVDALRYLGRQDEALTELTRLPPIAEDPASASLRTEYVRLKGSLLCDIGDFESALQDLIPATSPVSEAPHALLTLRGWAHQNCLGQAHAEFAEQVYRQALTLAPNDRWSRKGLANALRHLGGSQSEEARSEYQQVIAYAEELRARNELNPYDSCLGGWCLFCTGRFREGAELYASGLAVIGTVAAAAQFDYGLILLADLSFSAAKVQFERTILEIKSKNCLRRCGLLYVALLDLQDAVSTHPTLKQANETHLIQAALAAALQEAVAEFAAERPTLAQRMLSFVASSQQDAESVDATLAAMLTARHEDVDWGWFQLSGLLQPNPAPSCAVLMPLLHHKRAPDRLFTISESGSLLPAKPDEAGEKTIVRLALKDAVSAATRVLLVSKPMVEALDQDPLASDLAAGIRWQEIAAPLPYWVGITLRQTAHAVLDQWAERLTSRAVELLVQAFRGDNAALSPAATIAAFALSAAVEPHVQHQALLVYGVAQGGVSEREVRQLQPRIADHLLADPETLRQSVDLLQQRLKQKAAGLKVEPGAEDAERKKWMEAKPPMIQGILKEAYEIARIEDKGLQYRRAAEASKRMQLVEPLSDALQEIDARLKESLKDLPEVYLDDNESIKLMSRNPAFYGTSVLLPKTRRPAIQSFHFLKATREMHRMELDLTAEIPHPAP